MDPQAAASVAGSSRQPADPNRIRPEDAAARHWFRFVLAYPPHMVRHCPDRLDIKAGASVLGPFAGTGTTSAESEKLGIASLGIEPIGVSRFAERPKLDRIPDPRKLVGHAQQIADAAYETLAADGISDTPTGITYDSFSDEVWASAYSRVIHVYAERDPMLKGICAAFGCNADIDEANFDESGLGTVEPEPEPAPFKLPGRRARQ